MSVYITIIYNTELLTTNPIIITCPTTFHITDEPFMVAPMATKGQKLRRTGKIYLKSELHAYAYFTRRAIKAAINATPCSKRIQWTRLNRVFQKSRAPYTKSPKSNTLMIVAQNRPFAFSSRLHSPKSEVFKTKFQKKSRPIWLFQQLVNGDSKKFFKSK